MGEFLQVFGSMTITELVIFFSAAAFVYDKSKSIYKWIIKRHDERQAQTQEHEEIQQDQESLFEIITRLETKINTITNGLFAVLSAELFDKCESAITQKEITINDLEKIKRLYEPYHNLGGNGTGTKLYNDCLRLPIKR